MTQDCINDSKLESAFLTTVEKYGDWELHYPDSLLEIWDLWHNPERFGPNASLHATLDTPTNIKWEDAERNDTEIGFAGYLTFGDYLQKRFKKLQTTMVNLLHAEIDRLNHVGEGRRHLQRPQHAQQAQRDFMASRFGDVHIEKEVLLLFVEIPEDYQEGNHDDDGFLHEIKRIPPSRERLESFTCQTYLRNAIRRFLNLKYYPSEVDFDSKIRDAARELIKAKKVELKTDDSQQKKAEAQIELEQDNDAALQEMDESQNNATIRFYSYSMLKLAGAPDKCAVESNYTLRRNEIPMIKPRQGNKVSIISPSDAKVLIEKLLSVFDGWVSFPQLRKAAWNHVRHTEDFVSLDASESIDSIKKHMKEESSFEFPKFNDEVIKQEILQQICSQRSDEIWEEICKITTDKFFCLYILPKDFPYNLKKDRHVWKEQDFGSTSTMSDKRMEVISYLKKETSIIVENNLKENPKEFLNKPRETWSTPPNSTKNNIKDILAQIFDNLNHRCKDVGYDPGIITPPQESADPTTHATN